MTNVSSTVQLKLQASGTQQVNSAFDSVKQKMSGVSEASKNMLKDIVAVAAGVATLEKAKGINDLNAQMYLLSKRTGMGVQFISTLKTAAGSAGVEFQDLADVLQEIPKGIEEAISGESSKIEALARLNLDPVKLKAMGVENAVAAVITQIGRLQPSGTVIKGVADLLGDSGVKMVNAFQTVAKDGMGHWADEAKRTGQIVTDEQAKAASELSKSMRIIGGSVDGAISKFMEGLAPALRDITNVFNISSKSSGEDIRQLGEKVGAFGKVVVGVLKVVGTALVAAGDGWKSMTKIAAYSLGRVSGLDFSLLKDPFGETIQYIKDEQGNVQKQVLKNWQVFKKQADQVDTDVADQIRQEAESSTKALQSLKDAFIDVGDATKNYMDVMKKYDGQKTPEAPKGGVIKPGKLDYSGSGLPTPGAPLDTSQVNIPPPQGVTNPGNQGTVINPNALAQRVALASQALAYYQQTVSKEVAIRQLGDQLIEANTQQAYAKGLISLQEYINTKQERTKQAYEFEIDALQNQQEYQQKILDVTKEQAKLDPNAQVAVVQAENNLEALKLDILTKQKELEVKLTEVEQERLDKIKEGTDELKAFNAEQAEYLGNTTPKLQLELEQRLEKYRQILLTQKKSTEEVNALVEAEKKRGEKQIQLEEAKNNMTQAMQAYELDKQKIQVEQGLGRGQEILGAQQLLDLDKQRVEVLKQIAQAQLDAALATGNQDAINQAQQQLLAVRQIEVNIRKTSDAFTQFSDQVTTSLEGNLQTFFESSINGTQSISQSWKTMVRSIVADLGVWAAKMLANYAIQQMLKAVGGLAEGGSTDTAAPKLANGGATTMPMGGMIYGQGTPTSDSNLFYAANREFIIRNPVVEQPGAFQFLHNFNKHGMPYLDNFVSNKYADGGLAGTADFSQSTSAGRNTNGSAEVQLGLEPGLVVKSIQSPEGKRVLIDFISDNKKTIKSLIS